MTFPEQSPAPGDFEASGQFSDSDVDVEHQFQIVGLVVGIADQRDQRDKVTRVKESACRLSCG